MPWVEPPPISVPERRSQAWQLLREASQSWRGFVPPAGRNETRPAASCAPGPASPSLRRCWRRRAGGGGDANCASLGDNREAADPPCGLGPELLLLTPLLLTRRAGRASARKDVR